MKKTYKSSLLALSVLASFTSCSESESLQQANLSKDKITFHATLDNTWKPLSPASSSRAAIAAATEKGPIVVPTPFGKPLYLHPVVQDGIHIWSKEGKPITRSGAPLEDVEHERVALTRGTMSTKTDLSDYQSFGVTAIYKNGENKVSLFQEENGDPKIAVATSTTEDKVWEIKDSRWPVGSEVSFHAFAPYSAVSTSPLSFKPDVDGEKTLIKYTALTGTEEIKAQPDLILATAKGSQSDNALGLNFSHALTAVTFAIDKDLADVLGAGKKLTSITLSGIPNEGTYDLAVMKGEGTAAPVWQFAQDGGSNKTGEYIFDLKDQDIVTGKDFALTSDNNTLMMIPQTLPESAKLNFQFDLDGVLQSLTIDMKDQVWQPGKSVIYKLSASAINSLTNTEVVYPTTWNEAGYPKKAFDANEAIGLYAVSKDNKIVASNVKLVKQKNEKGEEIWKTTENKRFLYTANYRYFAYYPYDSTLKDEDMNAEATDADGFFAKKITGWNPVTDQKDVLLKQDLQVASGVVEADASTLTFEMAHSMGLAVLNLKSKEVPAKRTFTTNNYTYYFPKCEGRVTTKPAASEYTDATETETVGVSKQFEGNVPYLASSTENRYVQIVKPATDVAFKAAETSVDNRDSWGFLEKDKNTFNVEKNSVSSKDITADAEFYNFARYYTTKDIMYSGNPEECVDKFIAPVINRKYLLQCWGSKGMGAAPGRGGYAEGKWEATADITTIYVCCGNDIGLNNFIPVFYYNVFSGSKGGGATHITKVRGGLLNSFENEKNNVLLVAGAGGGQDLNGTPGDGGGLTGGTSRQSNGSYNWPTGGTQTGGAASSPWEASNAIAGTFGLGGVAWTGNSDYGGAGGSGWYGGGGIAWTGSGGGGSSYIDGVEDGRTIPGWEEMPAPKGGKQVGHSDTGVCIITSQFTK